MSFDEQVTRAVGENVDALVTLDMRGYGVPARLYPRVRERVGAPLVMTAAQGLRSSVNTGDVVLLGTGFVFLPPKKGELDGMVGTALVARAIEIALGAVPVVVVEDELVAAAEALLRTAGLNVCASPEEAVGLKHAAAVVAFPKEVTLAEDSALSLFERLHPRAVMNIERPGRNDRGVYHMGNGQDVTDLAAKYDAVFDLAHRSGIPTLAIGDLGNELGFGDYADVVRDDIPFGETCACPCGRGIAATVGSDYLVVAAVSDWGAYALAACLAHVSGEWKAMVDRNLLSQVLDTAVGAGLLDGSGYAIPAVDGIQPDVNGAFVELLNAAVRYPNEAQSKYRAMYERMALLAQS